MAVEERPYHWRSIVLPALLPTLLFSIGEGAIIPIIPVVADGLGATLAAAGVISALLMIGELLGNIPSGWLIVRVGERSAMIGATGLSVLGLVAAILAPNPAVLGLGVFVIGLAAAVFSLARHAFMTSYVPLAFRARALSLLGGTFRLGFFIGPFLTALAIQLSGDPIWAFWIHVAACLVVAVVLLFLPDPATFGRLRTVRADGGASADGVTSAARESAGLFTAIGRHRKVLATVGAGGLLVAALRASRQAVLPLWAVSIGIGGTSTAVIIGVAGAIDFALFYLGGQIMDRYGRLASAVPSILGLALGHFVLALTHDLESSAIWFIVAAMLLAVANGIGTGLNITLGADLADPRDPAPFLGAWRFTCGIGAASAPLLLSGVTALTSLAIGAGVLGAFGVLGAGILWRYVPRHLPRR